MFNTAPASDFELELAKPKMSKDRLKAAHLTALFADSQRIVEAQERIVEAQEQALAATEREAAAAARAEANAKEVAAAAARAEASTVRAVQAEAKLEQRSLELLRIRGRLSMRGVFDHIEEELKRDNTGYAGLSRRSLWLQVIRSKPQLRECLAQPAVFNSSTLPRPVTNDDLANLVVGVYKTLSEHNHSNKSPAEYIQAGETLEIVEGQLSKRQCRALYCVAKVFGFPAELKLNLDSDSE